MPFRCLPSSGLRNSVKDGYSATTRGIEVTVHAQFLADQSDPDNGAWVWAYRVRIHNQGAETVQLLRRTWRITDARGRVQVVQGAGVVGEQPVLEPGETFEYTSGTPLETASGIMVGAYHLIVVLTQEPFDATIPAFSLDSPSTLRQVH